MDISLRLRAGTVSAALVVLALLDLASAGNPLRPSEWMLALAGALPVALLALALVPQNQTPA